MDRPRRKPSPAESRAALAVLLALAAVGTALFLQQFRYDPGQFRLDGAGLPGAAAAPRAGDLDAPPGTVATGPTEHYDRATLSDRINGRADLYLEAGFRALRCRRFASAAGAQDGVEACLYDQGTAEGAFSVWSRQRREGAPDAGIGPRSYATATGVFLASGRLYAEVLAARPDPASLEVARRVAAALAALGGDGAAREGEPPGLALLPARDRVPGSETLLAADAFGMAGLDRVALARYRRDGAEATAFVTVRGDAAAATALSLAWRQALLDQGASPLAAPAGVEGAWVLDAGGLVEGAFARGPVLAGVHEADDRALADGLLADLQRAVGEGTR